MNKYCDCGWTMPEWDASGVLWCPQCDRQIAPYDEEMMEEAFYESEWKRGGGE